MIAERASDMIKEDWGMSIEKLTDSSYNEDEDDYAVKSVKGEDKLGNVHQLTKENPEKWKDLNYW